MQKIKMLVNISILIALYYLVYYIYIGILNPVPALGDSWDYHIPISLNILDGKFLSHHNNTIPAWHYPGTSLELHKHAQWYYPASSEAINSIFIFLHIPLTISNIFATVVLFFCLRKLALTFRLDPNVALLFAITVCTLNVVLRWQNAVSVDIWVAVFFSLSLMLLENPKKTLLYFIELGFALGMLIGSKYTAVLFVMILLILYGRRLISYIDPKRALFVIVPFILFGLIWYLKNYSLTGNFIYPFPRLPLARSMEVFTFYGSIWTVGIRHPLEMINAGFGEYKLWFFSIITGAAVLIRQFIIKKRFSYERYA